MATFWEKFLIADENSKLAVLKTTLFYINHNIKTHDKILIIVLIFSVMVNMHLAQAVVTNLVDHEPNCFFSYIHNALGYAMNQKS